VQKALDSLPGVSKVEVDFNAKTATLFVEKSSKEDDSRFISALEDAGFGGTVADKGTSK